MQKTDDRLRLYFDFTDSHQSVYFSRPSALVPRPSLMIELLTLLIFIAGALFWTDSMRAREAALDAGRRACAAEGVQLLDWTVMLKKTRFSRGEDGRMHVKRVYEFEFSDTGNNRIRGSITLLGRELLALNLPVAHVIPSAVARLH